MADTLSSKELQQQAEQLRQQAEQLRIQLRETEKAARIARIEETEAMINGKILQAKDAARAIKCEAIQSLGHFVGKVHGTAQRVGQTAMMYADLAHQTARDTKAGILHQERRIRDGALKVKSDIQQGLDSAAKKVKAVPGQLASMFRTTAKKTIHGVGLVAGTAIYATQVGAQKASEFVKNGVKVARNAKAGVLHHQRRVRDGVLKVKSDIQQGVNNAVKKVKAVPGKLASMFRTTAKKVSCGFKQASLKVIGKVGEISGKVVGKARETHKAIVVSVNDAKEFVKNSAERAVLGGKNFAKSMVRGMQQGAKSVANTMKRVGTMVKESNLVQTIKNDREQAHSLFMAGYRQGLAGR